MAREYFHSYHSHLEAMKSLNDAECGRLYRACLLYSATGEVPELRGNERFVFDGMRAQIDRDKKTYADKCLALSQNAFLRWDAKGCKSIQMDAIGCKSTQGEDKGKEDITPSIVSPPRFTPPTVDEVRAYCTERGNKINPQKFVDHYEASRWMRGKTPIKDWRACVRTWEQQEPRADAAKRSRAYVHGQRKYSDEEMKRIGVDLLKDT